MDNSIKNNAFTLAEIFITLAIVGVIAAITVPRLIAKHQEKIAVTALLKFYSSITEAISFYKAETGNTNLCSGINDDSTAFEPIAKHMRISAKCIGGRSCLEADWLPTYNLDYYGNKITSGWATITKRTADSICYLLQSGASFCIDVDPEKFNIAVDINNKKNPNRVGQDIFFFTMGYAKKDIQAGYINANELLYGLCRPTSTCNPDNTDPTKDGGAFPTAYVLKNKKLPPKI